MVTADWLKVLAMTANTRGHYTALLVAQIDAKVLVIADWLKVLEVISNILEGTYTRLILL